MLRLFRSEPAAKSVSEQGSCQAPAVGGFADPERVPLGSISESVCVAYILADMGGSRIWPNLAKNSAERTLLDEWRANFAWPVHRATSWIDLQPH